MSRKDNEGIRCAINKKVLGSDEIKTQKEGTTTGDVEAACSWSRFVGKITKFFHVFFLIHSLLPAFCRFEHVELLVRLIKTFQ